MSQPNFDLKELQDSVIGISRDLIIPENYVDEVRNSRQRSIRKIVDLYHSSRKNNRVFKHTYSALSDPNPFVRIAAADIIGSSGNQNSFDYLFKALEDEEYINVKQRIVRAIDNLESKIDLHKHKDKKKSTLKESLRVLSYTN
ncbi:MAG: HEAT repeat domain-containing protein [Candidatus Kariarchaeaceae archaeon]|jgi:HEAT repeat protein